MIGWQVVFSTQFVTNCRFVLFETFGGLVSGTAERRKWTQKPLRRIPHQAYVYPLSTSYKGTGFPCIIYGYVRTCWIIYALKFRCYNMCVFEFATVLDLCTDGSALRAAVVCPRSSRSRKSFCRRPWTTRPLLRGVAGTHLVLGPSNAGAAAGAVL